MNTRITVKTKDEITRIKELQKEIEQLKKLLLKKDLDAMIQDSYLEVAAEDLGYKSVAELKARDIFSEVKKKVSEGSNKDLKVVDIRLTEKSTGEISAGAGIGTSGGNFSFSISIPIFSFADIRIEFLIVLTVFGCVSILLITGISF